tara:strand:- start:666 stop:893 length:228 start_codon:yes stop_codon:yes gene_type:complete
MKTKKEDIKSIVLLIEERITELATRNDYQRVWLKIQNNLVEDFNNLVDLEKENNRLETQIESFANEFGYNVNEIK